MLLLGCFGALEICGCEKAEEKDSDGQAEDINRDVVVAVGSVEAVHDRRGQPPEEAPVRFEAVGLSWLADVI